MARYFAGNSLASFSRNSVTIIEDATSGRFDSALVPYGLRVTGSSEGAIYAEAELNANAAGTVWFHFEQFSNSIAGSSGNAQWLTLVNSASVPVFKFVGAGSSSIQAQVWSGSAWVNSGPPLPVSQGTLERWDLRFTCGNGGSFDLYRAGSIVLSGSGHVVSGVTADVKFLRLGNWVNSYLCVWSQVLIADFDTRDSRYRMPVINGNGALTDGTGGFADIAETVLDDGTSIGLTSSGQRKSFTKASITVPDGYRVAALAVCARARVTGGLSNGQAFTRVGGVNYDSPNLGFSAGYSAEQHLWETNPATSGDWTAAAFNGAEVGVEAV